jgi:hypothetical protein
MLMWTFLRTNSKGLSNMSVVLVKIQGEGETSLAPGCGSASKSKTDGFPSQLSLVMPALLGFLESSNLLCQQNHRNQ